MVAADRIKHDVYVQARSRKLHITPPACTAASTPDMHGLPLPPVRTIYKQLVPAATIQVTRSYTRLANAEPLLQALVDLLFSVDCETRPE
jgi:hypothetical protein